MKLKDLSKVGMGTVFRFPGESKRYIFSYLVDDNEVAIVPKGHTDLIRKSGDLEVIPEKGNRKRKVITGKEKMSPIQISRGPRSPVSAILLVFLTMLIIYLIALVFGLRLGG